MNALQPTQLQRDGHEHLVIAWSDGARRRYRVSQLRKDCPCATCREKRSAPPPPPTLLPVLSLEEAQPLRLEGMTPVGAYAYQLRFSDGHDSGLYTFERLRDWGEPITE